MTEALRLVFPQWQGADFSVLTSSVSKFPHEEAVRGYHLGLQLLSNSSGPDASPKGGLLSP